MVLSTSPDGAIVETVSLQLPDVFVIGSAKASLSVLGKNLQYCTPHPSVLFCCRCSILPNVIGSHKLELFRLDGATGSHIDVIFSPTTLLILAAILPGDLMGRALKNLDSLLAMPRGCGEQTMLRFAPNVYILEYLQSTKQLTPQIRERAVAFLRSGESEGWTIRFHVLV